MDIGIGLPTTIPGVEARQVIDWSREADAAGFSSLATLDRIVYRNYEPLIALAAAAAVTDRITLLTGILITPYRTNTALLAKEAATLHHLSDGRLVLGVGIGARGDDYEASGLTTKNRGRVFDRQLAELQRIWAGEERGTAGAIGPALPDGPPELIIGGKVDAAFERAARWGAGWISGAGGAAVFGDVGRAPARRVGARRPRGLAAGDRLRLLRARGGRARARRPVPARLLRLRRRIRRSTGRGLAGRRGVGGPVPRHVRRGGLRRAAVLPVQLGPGAGRAARRGGALTGLARLTALLNENTVDPTCRSDTGLASRGGALSSCTRLFNDLEPELVRCPYGVYQELRDAPPAYVPELEAYPVTRFADIQQVLNDAAHVLLAHGEGPGPDAGDDGPAHHARRRGPRVRGDARERHHDGARAAGRERTRAPAAARAGQQGLHPAAHQARWRRTSPTSPTG